MEPVVTRSFASNDLFVDSIHELLCKIGENTRRKREISEKARKTAFEEQYDGLITVKDIVFNTYCEHHLIPFSGKVHIGLIPCGKVTGLIKIVKLVEMVSLRPLAQEKMAQQVAEEIMNVLQPRGAIVTVEETRLCMCAKGENESGTAAVTTVKKGIFDEDVSWCAQFERALSMS